MKSYFIVLILSLLSTSIFAQADREDVVYLKNGSVYRGTLVEQIPNVSYKIEILGGTVILLQAADVEKITKEERLVNSVGERTYKPREKPVYEYYFRPKGYFFQAQLLGEAAELGFRIVNGYKFNRFAYLGLGMGVDGLIVDIHGSGDYAGAYFPFFVHYGGDILKSQITPFYSVEAGYAFRVNAPVSPADIFGNGSSSVVNAKGGFMGGAGFGVRFYSKRKVHFDLSAHVDFKQSFSTIDTYNYNTGYEMEYSEHTIVIIPGIRFGLGF